MEPWMLAAMEEEGILDTTESKLNRLSSYLKDSDLTYVGNEEFAQACDACDLDPNSFSDDDLLDLQRKLND